MDIKNITVIGCGGGGACLLQPLSPVYNMHLCDGDIFEEANVTRQAFASGNIGENKATALAKFWNKNENTNITAHPHMMNGGEDLETDLIFCCVDNNGGRKAAYQLAKAHNVPLILIANESWEPMAWLHLQSFNFTNRDPFTRWKLGELDDGRQETCAGVEIIREIPQLPQANFVSAAFGVTIMQSMLMNEDEENYLAEVIAIPHPMHVRVRDIEI